MNNKKIWVVATVLFFLIGTAGGYFFLRNFGSGEKPVAPTASPQNAQEEAQDLFSLRMYYPFENGLRMVEKKVPGRTKQTSIGEAVIDEFFKGPGDGKAPYIPKDVRLLGLYRDTAQILYVDLSDELRRNFQGDAVGEYLLLKGLYDSLSSNLQDIKDVKILVEGKEIETLGGHLYLKYTLRSTVSSEFRGDARARNE